MAEDAGWCGYGWLVDKSLITQVPMEGSGLDDVTTSYDYTMSEMGFNIITIAWENRFLFKTWKLSSTCFELIGVKLGLANGFQ